MTKPSGKLKEGEAVVLVNISELPDDMFLTGDDEYDPVWRAAVEQFEHDQTQFIVTMVDGETVYLSKDGDEYCFNLNNVFRVPS